MPLKIRDTVYSSHGCWEKLEEIYRLEKERGNSTFEDVEQEKIEKYNNCASIWVTKKPIEAFKYLLSIEEWEKSNSSLKEKYPDYKERVTEIEVKDSDIVLTEDWQGGYLIVKIGRRLHNE